MDIYVSDEKIMKEAFEIVNEVYSQEELERFIMKLLRKFKEHADQDEASWETIFKYVEKQHKLELKAAEELEKLSNL